jgi:hypothetical protein
MLQTTGSPFFIGYRSDIPQSAVYGIVGPDGLLHNLSVVNSTDSDVDDILLRSMRHWRYISAKCGGDSVPWEMVIEFPSDGGMVHEFPLEAIPLIE